MKNKFYLSFEHYLCTVVAPMSGYCIQPMPVVHNNATFRDFLASITMLFNRWLLPVPAWPQISRLWPALAVFSAIACSAFNIFIKILTQNGKCLAEIFDQSDNALHKAIALPEVDSER